jgi:hypothetical protein
VGVLAVHAGVRTLLRLPEWEAVTGRSRVVADTLGHDAQSY